MGIPDRLYNLAKSYLDSARSRWDDVDAAAKKELDDTASSPHLAAWERAQAKIATATSDNSAAKELRSAIEPPVLPEAPPNSEPVISPLPRPSSNALGAAYKVLDVPVGSDLAAIQAAYHNLQTKADPNRFPENSKERKMAQDLSRRINAAYMMLANALRPASDDRFDRLEL